MKEKGTKKTKTKTLAADMTTTEWLFGITDELPSSWSRREPVWEDEQLIATNEHTFDDVVKVLYDNAE